MTDQSDFSLEDLPVGELTAAELEGSNPVQGDVLQTSSSLGNFQLARVGEPKRSQLSNKSIPVQVNLNLVARKEEAWTALNPVLAGEGGFNPVPLASDSSIGVYLLSQLIAGIDELRNNRIVGNASSVVENAVALLTTWTEETQSNLADSASGYTSREQLFRRIAQEFSVKVSSVAAKGVVVDVVAGFQDNTVAGQLSGQPLPELVGKLVRLGCSVNVSFTLTTSSLVELVTFDCKSLATELTCWVAAGFADSTYFQSADVGVKSQVTAVIAGDTATVTVTFNQE